MCVRGSWTCATIRDQLNIMSSSPGSKRRVLVTGAAGTVGCSVCRGLLDAGYPVRGFDRVPMPGGLEAVDLCLGELTDGDAVSKAVEDCDSVIHLAAVPYPDQPLPGPMCDANIVGLYHVMEACRTRAVHRVVLTSSVMVAWGLPWQERVVTLADGIKPDSHYALTKLFAEQTGEMYSRLYGMSVIAIRLGHHLRQAEDLERTRQSIAKQSIFVSSPDAGKAFRLAVEAGDIAVGGFATVYITSRHVQPCGFDLEPARRVLGYVPDDVFPNNALCHNRAR